MNSPTTKTWVVSTVTIGLILLVFFVAWMIPYVQTNRAIEQVLEKVKKIDHPPDSMELVEVDGWGHPLIFRFKHDSSTLIYTVISKGPDGKLDTEDDIHNSYVDYNTSRMAGQWAASRVKEFLKGVKDGATKKSKFDEQN